MVYLHGSCKRNWLAYNFIHTKRCNILNPKCATNLVYIYYNMKLIHFLNNIAMHVAQRSGGYQMHTNIAKEQASDSDIEVEVASDYSNMDEIDDVAPILVST